ncbi:hypothetical protein D9M72_515120 [compost metagenome]
MRLRRTPEAQVASIGRARPPRRMPEGRSGRALALHVSRTLNDPSIPSAHVNSANPVRLVFASTQLPADDPAVVAGLLEVAYLDDPTRIPALVEEALEGLLVRPKLNIALERAGEISRRRRAFRNANVAGLQGFRDRALRATEAQDDAPHRTAQSMEMPSGRRC